MRHIYLLVFILFVGIKIKVQGQGCTFTITIPDDITICEPGSINLNGIINGNYLGFNWTSSDGYYNDNNLNPSVFITKNTTFKLKVIGDPAGNPIINGDFSMGNSGFTSDYLFVPDIPGIQTEMVPEGTYSIVSNPNFVHSGFAGCSDHSGGGDMMVVNGAPSYSKIWCQTVAVTPNTTYFFQAFAASVGSTSPAILQFSINNVLLGNQFNLTGNVCRWDEFYELWNSGSATSVEICITNQNLSLNGNDFAIDDIFFGPLCHEEKEFKVTLSEFDIVPSTPQTLSCLNPETTISVQTLPTNNNYTYAWFTQNGNILGSTDKEEVSVTGAGTYFVTVTDEEGCSKIEVIDVIGDFDKPMVSIIGDSYLNCTKKSTTLTANTNTDIYDIIWTFPEMYQEIGDSIIATTPGDYVVQVTGENGCTNTATIHVEVENNQFEYKKDLSGNLTCSIDSVDIYLDIISNIDSISWNGPNIIHQNNSRDTITVEKAGVYIFEMFLGDGCSYKDSIKVDILPPLMQYKIPVSDTLTCLKTTVFITPDSLKGVENITWEVSGQNPLDQDTLQVRQSGIYYFTLTDINGCTTSDTIQVYDDIEKPNFTVDISPIVCSTNSGSFTVLGTGITDYQWIGFNESASVPNPVFTEEGTYTLIVTGINGCKDTMDYYLHSVKDFPVISSSVSSITCTNPQGVIDINTSIQSDITWIGPNGITGSGTNIISTENGIFKVIAVTEEGCTSEREFFIPIDTIHPELQTINDFLLTCAENIYKPTLNHGDYYSYLWEGPGLNSNTPLDITINAPGSYTLTLINENGCSVKRSFTVTENKQAPSFEIQSGDLSCKEPIMPLNLSGDALKYLILNGDTIQQNYGISQPGIYIFTGINELGCKRDFTLTVNGHFDLPKIDLNPVLLNCYEPQKWIKNTGIDQNLMISWETPNGLIQRDSIFITSDEPVTLIAFNDDGCKSTLVVPITTDFQKPEMQINGSDIIKCMEDFITLQGVSSTANAFEWKGQNGQVLASNPLLTVTNPGLYQLEGTNLTNGCTDVTSITITKQPSPIEILYTDKQPLCYGENGHFIWTNGVGGTPPYTLQLNNKVINANSPESLNSGTYYITLADANGCAKLDTLNINQIFDFSVDAGKDTIIQLGTPYQLNAISTLNQTEIKEIIWEPANVLNCSNCLNPIATLETDTRFTVTIYNVNGCVKVDNITVRVKFEKGYTAPNIINTKSHNGNQLFTIFPIENSIRKIRSLSIYDRWGNLIFTTRDIEPANPELGWNGTFLGRDVLPGVYVWKAEIEYKDDSSEIAAGDITIIR